MKFSVEEQRNMLKIYYSCQRNSARAAEVYFETYPEFPQPHRCLYQKLDYNISHYGSFLKPRKKYGSRVTNEERDQIVNEVI